MAEVSTSLVGLGDRFPELDEEWDRLKARADEIQDALDALRTARRGAPSAAGAVTRAAQHCDQARRALELLEDEVMSLGKRVRMRTDEGDVAAA